MASTGFIKVRKFSDRLADSDLPENTKVLDGVYMTMAPDTNDVTSCGVGAPRGSAQDFYDFDFDIPPQATVTDIDFRITGRIDPGSGAQETRIGVMDRLLPLTDCAQYESLVVPFTSIDSTILLNLVFGVPKTGLELDDSRFAVWMNNFGDPLTDDEVLVDLLEINVNYTLPPCIYCDFLDDVQDLQDLLDRIPPNVCECVSYTSQCDGDLPTYEEFLELLIDIFTEVNILCDLTDTITGDCIIDFTLGPCTLADNIIFSSDGTISITRLPSPDCRFDLGVRIISSAVCPLEWDYPGNVVSMNFNTDHFDCTGNELNALIPDVVTGNVGSTIVEVFPSPTTWTLRAGSSVVVPSFSPTGRHVASIVWEFDCRKPVGTAGANLNGDISHRVRRNAVVERTYNNLLTVRQNYGTTDSFDTQVSIHFTKSGLNVDGTYDFEVMVAGPISAIEFGEVDISFLIISII